MSRFQCAPSFMHLNLPWSIPQSKSCGRDAHCNARADGLVDVLNSLAHSLAKVSAGAYADVNASLSAAFCGYMKKGGGHSPKSRASASPRMNLKVILSGMG